eukprot:Skav215905  [mRNA]  locus=scaffold1542:145425:146315:- [translate_table: standard]
MFGKSVQSIQSVSDSTLLKMMAEKTNLTEALGVSDTVAELMQASYEELMERTDLEVVPIGFAVLGAVVLGAMILFWLFLTCMGGIELYGKLKNQQRQEHLAKLEKKREVYGKQQAMALWLFEKKFGKDQVTAFRGCLLQMEEKGASLLRDAGLDQAKLKKDLSALRALVLILVVVFYVVETFSSAWTRPVCFTANGNALMIKHPPRSSPFSFLKKAGATGD